MRIIESYSDELRVLEGCISRQATKGDPLRVLEAGCGREWYFNLPGVQCVTTGVDLDSAALEHRKHVKKDLTHAIVGDLRTVDLPCERFDVVYSSFVLEHIEGAETALDNLVGSLKPRGLLIVRVPDVEGVQSFLGRRLPHSLICFYYRHAWKIRDAGKPGFAPYPTFYDDVISRGGFRRYCEVKGLTLEDEIGVGSYSQRGTGPLRHATRLVARFIATVTGGKIHDRYVDLTFIARKHAEPEGHQIEASESRPSDKVHG